MGRNAVADFCLLLHVCQSSVASYHYSFFRIYLLRVSLPVCLLFHLILDAIVPSVLIQLHSNVAYLEQLEGNQSYLCHSERPKYRKKVLVRCLEACDLSCLSKSAGAGLDRQVGLNSFIVPSTVNPQTQYLYCEELLLCQY